MKINAKRKARRKAGALTASYSKTCNLIIAHYKSVVKYKRAPRASAAKNNYELIKSFNLEQLAFFLVNFHKVLGAVDNVKIAKRILRSEAII